MSIPNAFDTQFDTLQVLSFLISFQLSDEWPYRYGQSAVSLLPQKYVFWVLLSADYVTNLLSIPCSSMDGTGSSLSTTVF